MDPRRLSIPEAAAYRTLGRLLDDLGKIERILTILTILEAGATESERATHLRAVREAIATLRPIHTQTD